LIGFERCSQPEAKQVSLELFDDNVGGRGAERAGHITSKNGYEAWEHLKTKYEPMDDKAYAGLEMKFVQCYLESPRENPEKWVNDLIRINHRIANCHSTQ